MHIEDALRKDREERENAQIDKLILFLRTKLYITFPAISECIWEVWGVRMTPTCLNARYARMNKRR